MRRTFIGDCVKEERGSATLEFIILAIPLFIPFAFYLSSVHENTQELQKLHNLARQSARAFVTSPTEEDAPVRAEEVLAYFDPQSKTGGPGGSHLEISITCESTPCLTPNSRVTVNVKDSLSGHSAEASQVVDSWRDSA